MRTSADRRVARSYYALALQRDRRTPPPPVLVRDAEADLDKPVLIERYGARPLGWWERVLAWWWRICRRPPRRLYAESWSAAMATLPQVYQEHRWRPLEIYRVRRLPD